MISRNEILMGRDLEFPLSEQIEENLTRLLDSLNEFREYYGKPMLVSSGYRPGRYNKTAGGAKNSTHLFCQACDFHDNDSAIKNWVLANRLVLQQSGLYMEHPDNTPTWIHLQTRPTTNRIFLP